MAIIKAYEMYSVFCLLIILIAAFVSVLFREGRRRGCTRHTNDTTIH